ncbi:MAG: carboxypeptidase M32 [Candidatus Hodarchaeales archaeon]|jgi:carboxypeptidase Taq
MKELYSKFLDVMEELAVIEDLDSLANWDFEVMMPKKALSQRAKQIKFLSGLNHQKLTNPDIEKLYNEILNHPEYKTLTEIQKRNLELFKRKYERVIRVPEDLVKEIAEHKTKSTAKWKEAREKSDFSLFQPFLEKTVKLKKKQASFINSSKNPYDVLIDYYEPNLTTEIYSEVFDELKKELVPLIQKCTSSVHQPNENLIKRNCPKSVQKKLSEAVIPIIGYDMKAGRLDEAVHPFTSGTNNDVRITTRYDENSFGDNLFSVLHEGGHAIYEQNIPKEYAHQLIRDACSYGFHESQSRFYENIIGRSTEFWEFFLPKFKETTSNIFEDVELKDFMHAINRVKQSKIRVEADEVTYCLHIIIRFEIERDLFTGKIDVKDLPTIWNTKMKEYLDIEIKNDSEGVLQDIHWAGASFGYFPSYALGNLFGAQFLKTLEKDIPDWKEYVRKGNIKPITEWLTKNIHSKGKFLDPLNLIKEVTGEELSSKHFIEYLNEKYTKLYQLD